MVLDGGGVKNGMEGIVVGMVGSEGMVGIGGKVNLGIDGLVGKFGSGGSSVGLGSEGKGDGSVGLGKVGTTGKFGIEGVVVCKRLRAAKLMLMLMLKTTKKAKMNHLLDAMMERNSQGLEMGIRV